MTAEVTHPLRSDARDNRARILDAARTVFGEEGLGAPMREVARRAGVGPATLYRHFPAKRDLLTETFAEQRRVCRTAVRDALADPDPWHGFRTVIERICELHAHSRGSRTRSWRRSRGDGLRGRPGAVPARGGRTGPAGPGGRAGCDRISSSTTWCWS